MHELEKAYHVPIEGDFFSIPFKLGVNSFSKIESLFHPLGDVVL